MTHNLGSMNRSVYGMQRDIGGMNRTVSSGPFGMMNDLMPFSSKSNVPRPIQPSPVWPSYNPVPKQGFQQHPYARQQQQRPQVRPKPGAKSTVKTPQVAKKQMPKKSLAKKLVAKDVQMPGASPVSLKK